MTTKQLLGCWEKFSINSSRIRWTLLGWSSFEEDGSCQWWTFWETECSPTAVGLNNNVGTAIAICWMWAISGCDRVRRVFLPCHISITAFKNGLAQETLIEPLDGFLRVVEMTKRISFKLKIFLSNEECYSYSVGVILRWNWNFNSDGGTRCDGSDAIYIVPCANCFSLTAANDGFDGEQKEKIFKRISDDDETVMRMGKLETALFPALAVFPS